MKNRTEIDQDRMEALVKAAQAGDRDAEEAVFQSNLGLIYMALERFKNTPYDFEDLFQIGAIGLLKAIARFDFGYGVKFSTYAVPMIIGELKRYLRDDGILKVQRSIKEIYYRVKSAQDDLRREFGKEPTIGEIAERLGIELSDVVMAMEACQPPTYIYSLLPGDEKEQALPLINKVSDREGTEDLLEKVALKEAVTRLDPKEREVIVRRFFKDETQSAIAEDLGISQVQVSRLEKRALKKLRGLLDSI
ncbi:MAG: SigB/SigF/SigG family RNA polymerase sigma factor [Syntrophothermus sp.]|uniref:SigB/SigF/SigG family RNA polymerase sigma factor n=1 Tax=Syntrophothermus sp. TaxID=2736299 RepID=UPI00257C7498|nr:SigB/SigF/SigG family RNA polymerase sigma factor [Syntrophothermus sp.]NSW82310.1 SigB/SigF/SigG family RNA polymerase sigma factor [Syntrophothermus sp.]